MSDSENTDFSMVLASSVHDMKNSLGMLLNSLESVIRETPVTNETQSERFATLQYEASRINTELIQLLTIYRIQHNRLPVNIDEFYLIDLIEEQIARNHMLFQTRNIEVDVLCDEELLWYFDCELVGGVIHNVLVNGARYSRERMQVNAEIVDEELLITVADDGNGFPEAMLSSSYGDELESVSFTGGNTHLGLYFAREIAEMHKRDGGTGRIELSNGGPLGGGLFKLILP